MDLREEIRVSTTCFENTGARSKPGALGALGLIFLSVCSWAIFARGVSHNSVNEWT
jgi:hypothetical protein